MTEHQTQPQQHLHDKLARVPDQPGVYIFHDEKGRVIYVGKSRSLRSRVRSYFQASRGLNTRTLTMVQKIADLEWIIVDNEVEALILESNLIKEHHPEYNVKLRDDKHYPFIRVNLAEEFPRVSIARARKKDGARYFGPYTRSGAIAETMRLARRLFGYRTCSDHKFRNVQRPCLDYHIHRCPAPCGGLVDAATYRQAIDKLCLFLEGRTDEVIRQLEAEMEQAAERMEFERAAVLRDQIRAVREATERQKIMLPDMVDRDVIGWAREGADTCVEVLSIREGKLVGREDFFLDHAAESEGGEIITAFVKQYYATRPVEVPEVLVQDPVEEPDAIAAWLEKKGAARVRFVWPQRGFKRDLCQMAARNAAEAVALMRAERAADAGRIEAGLAELARALGLAAPPERIECYDISNLQGRDATGSMVVMAHGRPQKDAYRRFAIKTVEGQDDFASMAEVVRRRLVRGLREAAEAAAVRTGTPAGADTAQVAEDNGTYAPGGTEEQGRKSSSFLPLPDLLLIDGGRGQVNAVRRVLAELGLGHLPVAGIAKEHEYLILPGRAEPVILPAGNPGLLLVEQIRDEAHRFAVGYHRKRRGTRGMRSLLDDVEGIGPRRKRALLKKFGSVAGMKEASVNDLAAVEGMNLAVAQRLYDFLHPG